MKLYDMPLSGNCYKVRLLLSFLGLEHEIVPINLMTREQKKVEFLTLNLMGQVPVLEDNGVYLRDSQAILFYLAQTYGAGTWLPIEPVNTAKVVQWLSTAANEIAYGLSAARVFYLLKRSDINIELATARSHQILNAINQHLASHLWLELDQPSIADVACFPYIAMAHEGKINIEAYPHVSAWVQRFKQLPHFIALPSMQS